MCLSIAKDAFWAWGLQLRQAVGSELLIRSFAVTRVKVLWTARMVRIIPCLQKLSPDSFLLVGRITLNKCEETERLCKEYWNRTQLRLH